MHVYVRMHACICVYAWGMYVRKIMYVYCHMCMYVPACMHTVHIRACMYACSYMQGMYFM